MRVVRWVPVVAFLAFLTACGSTGNSAAPPTTSSHSTAAAEPTTAGTAAPPTTVPPTTTPSATVGTKFTLKNGSTVQLLSYGPGTPSTYYSGLGKSGTSLVAAVVQGCVPAGGKATSFNPLYFSVKMLDNTKASAELGAVDGQIDSTDVTAGDCVRGNVGFAVPAGTKASDLYFAESLLGTPVRWTLPETAGSSTATAPTTTTATTTSALTVVQDYFAAINARDFRRAWNLGGKNLHGGDYATFVQGFSTTLSDTITSSSSTGNTVHITLEATQTSGEKHTYQGTYTVSNGVIVSAKVSRIS